MWYHDIYDGWGAQHGCAVTYEFRDGMVYSIYMSDWTDDVELPVEHGPAPLDWVNDSDYGIIPNWTGFDR